MFTDYFGTYFIISVTNVKKAYFNSFKDSEVISKDLDDSIKEHL